MLTPGLFRGKRHLRILDLAALTVAELLSQLNSACRAAFHTLTAGHTFCLLYFSHVSRTGHIWCIKQLRRTQRITDIDITVADSKNLVRTVDIGDLVYKTVVLSHFKDLQCFLFRNIASVFLGLHHIIRHISHSYAPTLRIIGTAFIMRQTGTTTGTGTGCIFSLVLAQPIGNMLQINGLILHLDGLLHRNYMHTDTGTALRHKGGDLFQRKSRHVLEKDTHFRMLVQHLSIHVKEFSTARHVHGQHILFFMCLILPVVFQKAFSGHLLQKCLTFFLFQTGKLYDLQQRFRLADAQFQSQLRLFVRNHRSQTPIFRILPGDFFDPQLLRNAVRDHLAQLCNGLTERFRGIGGKTWILVFRIQFFIQFFFHQFALLIFPLSISLPGYTASLSMR